MEKAIYEIAETLCNIDQIEFSSIWKMVLPSEKPPAKKDRDDLIEDLIDELFLLADEEIMEIYSLATGKEFDEELLEATYDKDDKVMDAYDEEDIM